MKKNKVYKEKSGVVIVCYKGSHYVAPGDSKFKDKAQVGLTAGETPDTVVIEGTEVWTSRGSYIQKKGEGEKASSGAKPSKSKKTSPPKVEEKKAATPEQPTVTPKKPSRREAKATTEAAWKLIEGVGGEEEKQVRGLMYCCLDNWLLNDRKGDLLKEVSLPMTPELEEQVRSTGMKIQTLYGENC